MKAFYTDLGVDIFKDAVSLPGVSQQYILRKTLQPRRGYRPPELYAPNKEAYGMLKAAVVGGPSLVFTRKHVAGETHIRSHQYGDGARLARRILGYDANSLYPSTMMKEMPCGPGVVEGEVVGQAKVSSKGVNKHQNQLRWERYEQALEGRRDMATNRGFRMHNGAMYTYEQRKLGLSAYYDKRWLLPDGIHTEPIEFHQPAGA